VTDAIEKLLDRLPDGSDPRTHVLFQAEIGAARAELGALRAENAEQFIRLRGADRLAAAVDRAVRRNALDARSEIADARLDYGEPAQLDAKLKAEEQEVAALRAEHEAVAKAREALAFTIGVLDNVIMYRTTNDAHNEKMAKARAALALLGEGHADE